MGKKGSLHPKDFLALSVIFIGCAGFVLWGLGYSTIGTPVMRWIGGLIVGLACLIFTFLSRWFM
ncbi:hypothetical protein KY314_00820 [Candidatus Woesearchaeota archaeon]|nr:hypothetical protein [Candidatus Woesearchaeota archaeon]